MGVLAAFIGIILYIGLMALCLWIGYLIQKAAVKNGVKEAFRELRQNVEL